MMVKKLRCIGEELEKILEENPKHALFLDSPYLGEYVRLDREALKELLDSGLDVEVGVILSDNEIIITRKSLVRLGSARG